MIHEILKTHKFVKIIPEKAPAIFLLPATEKKFRNLADLVKNFSTLSKISESALKSDHFKLSRKTSRLWANSLNGILDIRITDNGGNPNLWNLAVNGIIKKIQSDISGMHGFMDGTNGLCHSATIPARLKKFKLTDNEISAVSRVRDFLKSTVPLLAVLSQNRVTEPDTKILDAMTRAGDIFGIRPEISPDLEESLSKIDVPAGVIEALVGTVKLQDPKLSGYQVLLDEDGIRLKVGGNFSVGFQEGDGIDLFHTVIQSISGAKFDVNPWEGMTVSIPVFK